MHIATRGHHKTQSPPTRDRTWDPQLKRLLLYRLSYGRTLGFTFSEWQNYTMLRHEINRKLQLPSILLRWRV